MWAGGLFLSYFVKLFALNSLIANKRYLLLFLFLVTVLYSCKQTRRLEQGQYLLVKNTIIIEGQGDVKPSELEYVLKQKPNRKIFGSIPFHLFMYNLPNPQKLEKKALKRKAKCEQRSKKLQVELDSLNAQIDRDRKRLKATRGKDSVKTAREIYNLELKRIDLEEKMEECKPTWREWMRYTVGEEPVTLDSSKVISSLKNLNVLLFKKGYFNNYVRDSIVLDSSKRKAEVIYVVKLNSPYVIRNINYSIKDQKLNRLIDNANKDGESLIHSGANLSFDALDHERDRITTYLKDKGYHFFSKEFIYFDIDSSIGNKQVDLVMGVKNALKQSPVYPDSLIEVPHQRFVIADIFINTDYDPAIANSSDKRRVDLYDTLYDKNTLEHYFIYLKHRGLRFKPHVLLNSIYIKRAYTYRAKEVEATFKKLSSLGVFRSINIKFEINPDDPTGTSLNCYINLSQFARQSVSLESNGTNRGGNLGIAGNFTYRNKNTFRGAETFKFSMSGGIEAQQVLANEDQSLGEETGIGVLKTFNTLEFGPEVSLYIPKFLSPFNLVQLEKTASPKTVFTATLNYQNRPDFSRTIQDVSFAYEWKKGDNINFYFSPTKLSAVKINPDSSFTARLEQINDQFLLNSYRDHFIIGNQFRFEYNNLDVNKPNRNTIYLKVGLEQSGNLMRLGYELAGMSSDSVGKIFGIQFAQFIKTDIDFRFTQIFNRSSKMVYRVAGGIGLPQKNFNQSLPFEKSFFVGGANGLRGWKARTLGPGGYMPAQLAFDKIGDVYLEGNLEYRFDLFGFLKAAMFVDAGNIWNLRENTARPGSQISENFYKELAMDGGLGLRFDLDFFIIRFDFAIPLKEPGLMEGERWIFQDKDASNAWLNARGAADYKARVNLNLGIGYPF